MELRKSDYLKALKTKNVLNHRRLLVLNAIYTSKNHKASSAIISSKTGIDIHFVNLIFGHFAKAVAKSLNIERNSEKLNSDQWWPIIAKGNKEENGYNWQFRKNFLLALEELNLFQNKIEFQGVDNPLISTIDKIYDGILRDSNSIIQDKKKWKRELASAKNYVCTPDFKNWTFGKSVGANGEYHNHGGVAKQSLYSLGFINALGIADVTFKSTITKQFKLWARKVTSYSVLEKFETDQLTSKRFELLVHKDLLRISKNNSSKNEISNQREFDDGFRKIITQEVNYRNKSVIKLAKSVHGTACILCDFDFSKTYGEHGQGFIEMHHLIPISEGKRKTKVEDLAPVCANCHRMLHKGKKTLSIKELKTIIEQNKTTKEKQYEY